MSYRINPMTDEEIEEAAAKSKEVLPDGRYAFLVAKSTRKIYKSGNPMAELQLTCWDNTGKPVPVFDYLVFSNIPLNIKKVSHFCKATGLHEEYKKGEIPEELDGLAGELDLKIQDPQPNDKGGFYPRKNVVVDYISGNIQSKSIDDFQDDKDLPF